ncbi:Rossmann-fold NAD(P)-binding domain-containing protein [Neisseria zalophi]|nr:SDR family NAD(P)-dependent oxidoreductase [Neisseria zalophi]
MNTPDCAILGMGYLGRPLAEKFFEQGSHVSALKRHITSDDINLPIDLHAADLNQAAAFQANFWPTWADKPVWFCLLPPSAVNQYADALAAWLALAEQYGIGHIVYSSSTGVYGNEVRECSEHSTPNPHTESTRKVWQAEQLFLNSSIENIDILRFGGLYSIERHPLNSLLKRRQIAGAHQPVNVIHQSRAVEALHYAACTPNGRRIRNIVENRHPPKQQFYQHEAAKLGLPEADFAPDDDSSGKIVTTVYHDFAHFLA